MKCQNCYGGKMEKVSIISVKKVSEAVDGKFEEQDPVNGSITYFECDSCGIRISMNYDTEEPDWEEELDDSGILSELMINE